MLEAKVGSLVAHPHGSQGLWQGLNHQGGIQGTVFSITGGLQSQKKSLLSFLLPPWIKKEDKTSLRKKGCLWSTD